MHTSHYIIALIPVSASEWSYAKQKLSLDMLCQMLTNRILFTYRAKIQCQYIRPYISVLEKVFPSAGGTKLDIFVF